MLDHELDRQISQPIKIESQSLDSGKATVYKRNQLSEKCNAENLIDHQTSNVTYTDKQSNKTIDKLSDKSLLKSYSHVNNILFEKNHIDTTSRMKNSPIQVKKKLNLEEYLKRRPDLKLNPSKSSEIKVEINDWTLDSNQSVREQESPINPVQNLYEEIIVVSIGSNTDVTIPPNDGDVQSIKLISKITDTIAKVTNDGEHIPSNSLIASIRDVIIKKSNSLKCSNNVSDGTKNEKIETTLEHGEDKTIMHLKKDRIRTKYISTGIQTDCDIRFPTLEKFTINRYAKSLSRSSSTSSRSSYSSFASENRKSKILTSCCWS